MEGKFAKIDEFIENGDKEGMLNYIKEHQITPEDFSTEFCYDYPIDRAATFGEVAIFNALVELGFKVEGIEIHPIYEACYNGYLGLVRALVETHGVNPSEPDPYGGTAMSWSMPEGNLDVIMYLVSAGVSVNERISPDDYTSITALHLAAVGSQNEDICKYLISKGAEIEAVDHKGDTPLHFAARELSEDIVEILLDAGASIDARNHAGETPFLTAAKAVSESPWESNSALKLLYTRGADPLAEDCSGKTALNYAMGSYKQAYFLLVEVNLTPNSPSVAKELFNLALEARCKYTINLLVNLGHNTGHIDGIYDETNPWTQSEEVQEVMKFLREISSQPQRLVDLCCFKIRNLLGIKLPKVIGSLPITENFKNFIRLRHLPSKMDD